ncbi:MAG TPA: PPE family protein [Mycobacterium sp.]|jgi:PPE-repeat protein|nr:PPE family protein [Mycobacterium sp.]
MVLDFAAMPPEMNSALMYAGAGAGPLMAAATAWNNLAAELSTTATQWESIITALTTEQWTGAGSAAAAAAAQPIVSWLTTTAAAAEQAGAQATASAAAYEAAFAATVPPPVIAANRAQLAALVATNFLGVNTPAIMATEAHYAEMWVQDATTMYTYQATSTATGVLQPVTPLSPATNPAGQGLQAASVAQATTSTPVQALTNAVSAVAPAADPPSDLLTSIDGFLGTPAVTNTINGSVNTAAWFVMNTIPTAVSLGHTLGSVPSIPFALSDAVAPAAGEAAILPGTMVGSVAPMGAAASAGLGEASAVGGLSVPASWSAAAPASMASSTAPLAGSGWTAATEQPVAAMPGMPGMAAAAKGAGAYGAGPRYGVKPIVMPKQVVV